MSLFNKLSAAHKEIAIRFFQKNPVELLRYLAFRKAMLAKESLAKSTVFDHLDVWDLMPLELRVKLADRKRYERLMNALDNF